MGAQAPPQATPSASSTSLRVRVRAARSHRPASLNKIMTSPGGCGFTVDAGSDCRTRRSDESARRVLPASCIV